MATPAKATNANHLPLPSDLQERLAAVQDHPAEKRFKVEASASPVPQSAVAQELATQATVRQAAEANLSQTAQLLTALERLERERIEMFDYAAERWPVGCGLPTAAGLPSGLRECLPNSFLTTWRAKGTLDRKREALAAYNQELLG